MLRLPNHIVRKGSNMEEELHGLETCYTCGKEFEEWELVEDWCESKSKYCNYCINNYNMNICKDDDCGKVIPDGVPRSGYCEHCDELVGEPYWKRDDPDWDDSYDPD